MTMQTSITHPHMQSRMATIFMMENDLDSLPVMDGDRLVGIVFADDISRANDREFAFESEFTSMIGVE
jgi:CBS domain-containing protein